MPLATTSQKSGYFITLEGGEGAGKSTVLQVICDVLTQNKVAWQGLREPGGTALGEALRHIVLDPAYRGMSAQAELLIMFAARAQLLEEKVLPTLSSGCWVVSDRFTDASFAYQGGGRGLSTEWLLLLEKWVLQGFKPMRTYLLDVPVNIGFERVMQRGAPQDRLEQENRTFFERVRQSYLARAAAEPERFLVVDATQPLDVVTAAVKQDLDRWIKQWQKL